MDGDTVTVGTIVEENGKYGFSDGVLKNSEYLATDNLWAVYSRTWVGSNSGYLLETTSGDHLAEKLYEYNADTSVEHQNTKIRYSHDLLFTTADFSGGTALLLGEMDAVVGVTSFPYDISGVINNLNLDPLHEVSSWTAWYNIQSTNDRDNYYYRYHPDYPDSNCKPSNYTSQTSSKISDNVVKDLYGIEGTEADIINNGKTIIELHTGYKTFELPVYDAMGKNTNKKVSVTQTNTDTALKDLNGTALTGKYKLIYKKDSENTYTSTFQITDKDGLWTAIGYVADEYNEFDASKAILIRDVTYSVSEASYVGSQGKGLFISLDLLNGETSDAKKYFDSHSATGDNIWQVVAERVDNNYIVFTNDVKTTITNVLNTIDTDSIILSNMANIAVTSEKPTVGTKFPEEEMIGYLFDYSVNTYPISTDGLDDFLTEKKNPNAGYKYDAENWSLWGFTAESGALIKCSVPISDKSKIGIDEYNNMSYRYADELLVYFPQVELTASVTVPAPTVGAAPAAKDDLIVNDDCTVTAVKWFDGNTELTNGDKFKSGKQYTIKVTLKATDGLQLVATTPTKIAATNSTEDPTPVTPDFNAADSTLTITHTFDALPLTAIPAVVISVTAPEIDKTPDTAATIENGAYYTASAVTWSPADEKFKAETAYTASVKLTPAFGYKFTANTTAKINGVNAQITPNNDGSITVSRTFDEIQLTAIPTAEISVTAPKLGKTPNTTATLETGANYSASAVTWSPADAQFIVGKAYKASVKLTPNSGYIFAANTTATINGKTAQTTLNNDGTLTVSYTFGKLSSGTPVPGIKPGKPVIEKNPAKTEKSKGWSNIISEINAAAVGSTIKITLNDETIMPEDALKAAIDRKVKLVLDADYGRTWTINGTKASSGKNIDLSVSSLNVNIPAEADNGILCTDSKQLKLNARALNFTAQLTASIGENSIGQNAAVYLYNEETGKLMFRSITVVDKNGNITFDVEVGGKYFIALGNEVKAPTTLCGDVNGDGVVNALDASAILKNVVDNTPTDKQSGDVNSDGVENALDAALILKYVVGDIKTLSISEA